MPTNHDTYKHLTDAQLATFIASLEGAIKAYEHQISLRQSVMSKYRRELKRRKREEKA